MKRNDCDDFPDTVIIGSSALYPLAKGAIQMLILLLLLLLLFSGIASIEGFHDTAHSIAQVVTTMAAMLDIFLCSITRKRIAENNPTSRMP